MINKDQYIAIAGKVADGTASDSELALYNAYYNEYQAKYPAWNKLEQAERKTMLDETALLVQARLRPVAGKIKLWPRIAVAAAAVTAITLGVWLYDIALKQPSSDGPEFVAGSKDIAPGKNRATLAFDGKVVTLSDEKRGLVVAEEKVSYNDGTALEGTAASMASVDKLRMLTAATPRGGTYHVTLPDGTRVWLNAASSLKFPSTFGKQPERRVELTGEAYFEVTKNKKQPFVVKSASQSVTVLGTRFNIESYLDDGTTRTTLVEGSVKVNRDIAAHPADSMVLKPGQQLALTGSALHVQDADVNEVTAWIKGDFVFKEEPLSNIMKELARWYDVEVAYQDAPRNLHFDAVMSRNKNLSAILNTMQMTGKVKFKVEGRKIIVLK